LLENNLFSLEQVHGTKIHTITTASKPHQQAAGDGVITNRQSIGLSVLTADCLPIIVVDKEQHVFGIFHAGWQGLAKGFLSKILDNFRINHDSLLENLYVAIGPHIHSENYHHNSISSMQQIEWGQYIQSVEEKFQVDLTGFIVNTLKELGVSRSNIWVSPIDTYSSFAFFSHRASLQGLKSNGRFLTVAYVKNDY